MCIVSLHTVHVTLSTGYDTGICVCNMCGVYFYVYMRMSTHMTRICVCMFASVYVYVFAYMCMYICVCIYVYVCLYAYEYVRT
jgi:hypothetical protein